MRNRKIEGEKWEGMEDNLCREEREKINEIIGK